MSRINVFEQEFDEIGRRLAGWFDSARATERVDGRREWDGESLTDVHAGANRTQALYRTAGGRWVLRHESAWQNEETWYEFVSDKSAREWLLVNKSDDLAEKYFGEIEDERGPGRPEVGPATNIRLGDDLTAKVDDAREDGESRAAAIRRLLAEALA